MIKALPMPAMIKIFAIFFISFFIFCSCNVTFPKETLKQDTEKLIKKETGVDSAAYICGSTMYLDVVMDGLADDNEQTVSKAYETIQKIVSNIVRVPLSSDADIKIVVVSIFDSDYKTLLRIFENIGDIKAYSHQLISRTDYGERQLMEFEGADSAKRIVENKHEISQEEFVARLIISQINMSARQNPFLGQLINSLQLQYFDVKDETICFMSNKIDNYDVQVLLKNRLLKESVKNLQKYKLFSIKSAIIYDRDKNIIFEMPITVEQN